MNFSVFTYTGLTTIHARNQKVTTIRFKTAVQNQRVPFANQENHSYYTNENSFVHRLKYGMKKPSLHEKTSWAWKFRRYL